MDAVLGLNIDEVIGRYLELKKKGTSYQACCPFHNERTPSFSVSRAKGVFKCFSCGESGKAITFVQKYLNLTYPKAVEEIAKQFNIPFECDKKELTAEELAAKEKRQRALDAMDRAQTFFVDQFGRSEAARAYALRRWDDKCCEDSGIGYAPATSSAFIDYCREHNLDAPLLFEIGLLGKSDSGDYYPAFRNRITMPIRDAAGRIVAFTARNLGPEEPKYINSKESFIFTKGRNLYGIHGLARSEDRLMANVVEGGPDVLRLHSLGLTNTVAALGTTWTEKQFELVKRYSKALRFIPDSDKVKDGEVYGAGIKAVMKNGAEAIRQGFYVTVSELPQDDPEAKTDPDEYITSVEIYEQLTEESFIVWYANKQYALAKTSAAQREFVADVADLLRHVADQTEVNVIIGELTKIHGKTKQWKDALARAKGEARQRELSAPQSDNRQKRMSDAELLRMFNLSIADNCYYTYDDEGEPTRLSNFILEPLYHIMDESNGTRIFKIINRYGQQSDIEFRESELCSLAAFTQRVGSLGNYVWRAKADKLNNVKEFVYAKTDSAARLKKMGWDAATEQFVFGNGVYSGGEFHKVDDLGIVRTRQGQAYYIPACSKMYRHNAEIYQFERLMVHQNRSGLRLYDYIDSLCRAFGENARIAFCYLLATIFRDIIYKRTSHFPILNLFGEKGTGKTTLALCLQSWFMNLIDPPSLGTTTIPAMNDRASQAVNVLAIFDEYKNDLDPRKIFFLKGLWGGGGQTKKNAATDGMAAQTMITNGVALCGQDKPTQDMALFTRLVYLSFTRTSFTPDERDSFDAFYTQCKLGLSHLTLQMLDHREMFAKNFNDAYSLTKSELGARIADEEVHDRIFGNWVIMLAAFRVLETVIECPFSYAELFETAVRGLQHQNDYAKESSETAGFWSAIQGFQTSGKCIERVHYRIKWHTSFRPIGVPADMEFGQAKPVLYLNGPAIEALMTGRMTSVTNNRSNWSTTMSYLKSHPSFLGLKQDRFAILTPQGAPDFELETVGTTPVKRYKFSRPKALCFDYNMLKEAFGIDLETEVMSDAEETGNPDKPQDKTLPF